MEILEPEQFLINSHDSYNVNKNQLNEIICNTSTEYPVHALSSVRHYPQIVKCKLYVDMAL